MRKNSYLLIVLFLAAAVPCFTEGGSAGSYSLEKILEEPVLSQLKEQKSIRYVHEAGEYDLKLLPKTIYADRALSNRTDKSNGGYITESLFLVDKDALEKNSTRGVKPVDTSMTAAARILRSISKMEGMKYFSQFFGKEAVLYNETYMIAGPDDRMPVPDKNTGNADGQVSYAYQHDNSFGGCVYKINYYQSDNDIYMILNNMTKMMFGFIKAVDADHFRANMIVMNCGRQYLVYISTDANCPRITIIDGQINDAFNSRLDALYRWFITQF
jgi:hypothetical protein